MKPQDKILSIKRQDLTKDKILQYLCMCQEILDTLPRPQQKVKILHVLVGSIKFRFTGYIVTVRTYPSSLDHVVLPKKQPKFLQPARAPLSHLQTQNYGKFVRE